MRDLTIYTDGSVYPNPNGIGGWAFVALDYDAPGKNYEYSGWHPKTTNNRMELTAAINALGIMARGSLLTIVTDSQYVQRCFARRRWPESKPNADLGRILQDSMRGRFAEVKLVAGHSGDRWNDRAHELANKARLEGVAWEKRRKEEESRPRKQSTIPYEVIEWTGPDTQTSAPTSVNDSTAAEGTIQSVFRSLRRSEWRTARPISVDTLTEF